LPVRVGLFHEADLPFRIHFCGFGNCVTPRRRGGAFQQRSVLIQIRTQPFSTPARIEAAINATSNFDLLDILNSRLLIARFCLTRQSLPSNSAPRTAIRPPTPADNGSRFNGPFPLTAGISYNRRNTLRSQHSAYRNERIYG
jgi:hypothetical protein